MLEIIVIITILFSFYIISAYATTDIIRLTKGNTIPVYAPNCYCSICNNKIRLIDQIPIFAYLVNHGKCHFCKSKIPIFDFLFEVFLFLLFSFTNVAFHFNYIGFIITISEYEIIKLIYILVKGKRENDFFKNLIISLMTNVFFFLLIGLLFFMLFIVRQYTN